jgi:uncharacterized protein (TIGR02217 family)
MSEVVFPVLPTLSWPVQRRPIWSTKVQESISGKETRIGLWSYPCYEYSISFDVLRSFGTFTELQQLIGFFNARNGSFDDWLFNDVYDNSATNAQFGVGNGTRTQWQLARNYGGYIEPVRRVNFVTDVRINGTPTAAYTVNSTIGTITFTTAPPNGAFLSWNGTFFWRCRFVEDDIDFNMVMAGYSELKSLKFRTLK